MDGGVNGPDAEQLESLSWKLVFGKEMVAQITSRINISGVVHMAIGVNIRPPDLIGSGIIIHGRSPDIGYTARLHIQGRLARNRLAFLPGETLMPVITTIGREEYPAGMLSPRSM